MSRHKKNGITRTSREGQRLSYSHPTTLPRLVALMPKLKYIHSAILLLGFLVVNFIENFTDYIVVSNNFIFGSFQFWRLVTWSFFSLNIIDIIGSLYSLFFLYRLFETISYAHQSLIFHALASIPLGLVFVFTPSHYFGLLGTGYIITSLLVAAFFCWLKSNVFVPYAKLNFSILFLLTVGSIILDLVDPIIHDLNTLPITIASLILGLGYGVFLRKTNGN